MTIKVGINGYGRIGRNVVRAIHELGRTDEFDVVALNDLGDAETNAHLTRYDTAHGSFAGTVEVDGGDIIVNGDRIKVMAERDPAKLPWGDLGVDVVFECTGLFRTQETAGKHIEGGAKKVVLSAPGGAGIDLVSLINAAHAQNIAVVAVLRCFDDQAQPTDVAHRAYLLDVIDYLTRSYHPDGRPIYDIDGIALAWEPYKGVYIPFRHRYLGAPQQLDLPTTLAALKPLLESERPKKHAQDAKSAWLMLKRSEVQLRGIGVEVSARGVASLYRDLAHGFVLDRRDAEQADEVRALGLRVAVVDTLMRTPEIAGRLAAAAIDLARPPT